MTAEIAAALTSLKAAAEIAKAMIGLHDAATIQAKIIELNREILSAQASALAANEAQSALLQRVGDLEKEIADMKAWETEREKYELKQVGERGAFAYTLKEQSGTSEPSHSLCPNCYEDGRKSILQPKLRSGLGEMLFCLRCRAEIHVKDVEFCVS